MTEQDQALADVLKWAVNPNLPTPALRDVDPERLVKLVQYHRILVPLVRRLDAERPAWCPVRLLTRLRLLQHQIRQHTRERLAVSREITQAMRERGLHPPIIVKGFAAHALTGHPDLLHYSGDIDPFAEDLPAFWDVAHALGYTGKRKDTHEWAKLMRGEVALDVHQHYPVLSYPPDVHTAPREEMEPERHPGHWRLPTRSLDLLPDENRVCWADLAAGAAPGVTPDTRELLFPSPAMMCLIHCAHCFRSSITRLHYMTPAGGFRLFELLSIHHLARLPCFDWTEFHVLVERFSAHDAVRFIDSLLSAFLGAALPQMPCHRPSDARRRFPEHLIWGGWVLIQEADDFLMMRDLIQTFSRLGAVEMPASASVAGSDLPRLLLYGPSAQPPLRVDVAWDAPGKMLRVCWETPPAPTARREFLIHFGYDSYAHIEQGADGTVGAVTQKNDYHLFAPTPGADWRQGAADVLTVYCPVPAVPGHHPERLHVFLAARTLDLNNARTEAVCYLPLVLQA